MERTGPTAYREEVTVPGITLREQLAAMAMQGILSSASFQGPVHQGCVVSAADRAVEAADALIAELNKVKGSKS
jgi:hypothetical protein